MFTVRQRDALREHLRLAEADEQVVAGAAVGSLAVDGGDRFSDLDLTFGIADHMPVADALDAWTRTLVDELDAVHLADLERGPTTYRVFLFPDALQLDLSMTPAARFRPAGPRFRLLFGETAADAGAPKPPGAGDISVPTPACRAGPLRVGRHLRAPRARLHRARACLAGGALRRHRARPRARAHLPPPGAARSTSARLRRPFGRDPGSTRLPTSVRSSSKLSEQPSPPPFKPLMLAGAEARLPDADTVAQRLAELR